MSALPVQLGAPAHGIQEGEVVRLHVVALGMRRARLESQRFDDARLLVVAGVGLEGQRQDEACSFSSSSLSCLESAAKPCGLRRRACSSRSDSPCAIIDRSSGVFCKASSM